MKRALAVALATALAGAAYADDAPWTPLKAVPGCFDGQTALQGFFDGFEHTIDADVFEAYGQKIAVTHKGAGGTYAVSGGAPVAVASWPAIVAFGTGPARRAVLIGSRGSALVWTSHWGLRFRVGKHDMLLVDADADGVLGETVKDGVPQDAIVVPYSLTASVYLGYAWTEDGNWELRGDATTLAARPCELPRKPEANEMNRAWRLFNAWRMAAGVGSVRWSEDSARGCRAHADYAERNQVRDFRENESMPGYSDEGDTAGRRSVMSFIYEHPHEAILEYMSTAYSLSCILRPELRECGMGIAGRTFCSDVNADSSGEGHTGAVEWVWPPHGSRNIARGFNDNGEVPMPVPGKELLHETPIGHAIVARIVDTSAKNFTLELRDEKGALVAGTLTCPNGNRPNHPGVREDNNSLVILAPNKPLSTSTRYVARLRFEASGECEVVREWSFATGSIMHRVL